MFKSGVIFAAVSLLLATGSTLLSPMCVPCLALFLGLGAGFLAGVFDKPADGGKSAKTGAVAGAIGGIGAIVGQMIGAGLNALLVGPEGAARLMEQWGLEVGRQAGVETGYWAGVIGSALCFSVLDIALMAGFGALGCMAWQGLMAKKKETSSISGEV